LREKEETQTLTDLADAARKLGWETAFMIDKDHNAIGAFAAPPETVAHLKALYAFDNDDNPFGDMH
jgi:hypothetical protein